MPPNARFEVVQGGDSVQQGDLIRKCPVPIIEFPQGQPRRAGHHTRFSFEPRDVVVLTQSCDIEQGNVREVLVCLARTSTAGESERKAIQKRRRPGLFFLPRIDELTQPDYVASFHDLFVVPLEIARDAAIVMDRRPRMRSPFREEFSRHLGDYFGRVALP